MNPSFLQDFGKELCKLLILTLGRYVWEKNQKGTIEFSSVEIRWKLDIVSHSAPDEQFG